MRHILLALGLTWLAGLAAAFEIEDRARFGPEDSTSVLRILSTADILFFEPMITSFLAVQAGAAIDYTVASSAEVMRAIDEEREAFDVVISSAMDLQTKLANDGKARRHTSQQAGTRYCSLSPRNQRPSLCREGRLKG